MVASSFGAGRLPACLLLHGPRGIGKQRFALWVAQLAVCEQPGPDGPCGTCRGCRMALALEHPDIHWYMPLPRPKGASGDKLADALEDARHETLAQYREAPLRASHVKEVTGLYMGTVQNLRRRASVRPSMAAGPVFIIGDAELLVPQEASQEAANALLKLLEEPPGAARFILTSSVPGNLLPTIRSRTVPLVLAPLPEDTVRQVLVDTLALEEPEATKYARLSLGSLGRAIGFVPLPPEDREDKDDDKGPMDRLRRQAWDILTSALSGRGAHAVALSYPPTGARTLVPVLDLLEEWLRDLAAISSGAPSAAFHFDTAEPLARIVERTGVAAFRIPAALPAVERARELARGNVNPQLVVAGLLGDLRGALHTARSA